jgi:chitin disaccharide deacetylase
MKLATRRVIITGDDFGLSPAVNTAIIRAHQESILTCASLMINAPAWQEAVVLARGNPSLCPGLHLTLIQGQAVLPHRLIPHLVDDQGNFPLNPVLAGLRYFFSRRAREEIRAELEAQVEKTLQAGLRPRFLNGHLNIHLHPGVWPQVVHLAKAYDIPAVRLARENLAVTLSLNPQRPVYKTVHAFIFAWLPRRATKTAGTLAMNDHLFGLLNDGAMDESFLLGLFPRLSPGVTEIYCHPALRSHPEAAWPSHYQPLNEFQALTSSKVAAACQKYNLELISFDNL